jgi:hypothetical protein
MYFFVVLAVAVLPHLLVEVLTKETLAQQRYLLVEALQLLLDKVIRLAEQAVVQEDLLLVLTHFALVGQPQQQIQQPQVNQALQEIVAVPLRLVQTH